MPPPTRVSPPSTTGRSSRSSSRNSSAAPLRRKHQVIGLIALRLQFIVDDGQAVNRRGFAAEDQLAQSDGQRAGRANGVDFRRSEIAFRSHPDTDRRRAVLALGQKGLEMLARMSGVALQRSDQ